MPINWHIVLTMITSVWSDRADLSSLAPPPYINLFSLWLFRRATAQLLSSSYEWCFSIPVVNRAPPHTTKPWIPSSVGSWKWWTSFCLVFHVCRGREEWFRIRVIIFIAVFLLSPKFVCLVQIYAPQDLLWDQLSCLTGRATQAWKHKHIFRCILVRVSNNY